MKVEVGERRNYLVCKSEGVLALCVGGGEAIGVGSGLGSHLRVIFITWLVSWINRSHDFLQA